MNSNWLANAFLVVGFLLWVAGIALLSVPTALVLGGAVLFVSGGLAATQKGRDAVR